MHCIGGREESARQSLTVRPHRQQSGKSFKEAERMASGEKPPGAQNSHPRAAAVHPNYVAPLFVCVERSAVDGVESAVDMRRGMWRAMAAIAFITAAIAVNGCAGGHMLPSYRVMPRMDAAQGKQVIEQFECGTCHTIPGIRGAKGVFGPPLMWFGKRSYIAGDFPNTPGNLTQWILNPPAMKPKTAMPLLGLSRDQARDAAAYLENLR
jgi:cytochrome c